MGMDGGYVTQLQTTDHRIPSELRSLVSSGTSACGVGYIKVFSSFRSLDLDAAER